MLTRKGCQHGQPCLSQGKASQSSSGQSCCRSKTETCAATSGSPKVTRDKEKRARCMFARTLTDGRTHPNIRLPLVSQEPPARAASGPLWLSPVICCLNYVSSQPGLPCHWELQRRGLPFTLAASLCPALTLFLGGRHRAAALATWTSSRLLRHVTLWL